MANELTAVVTHTQLLKEALMSRCDGLPAEVTDVLLSKFSINGAIPLTTDNMRQMLEGVVADMRREIRDVRAAESPALPTILSAPTDSRFHVWSWGGKMQMVPEGWVLPSSTNVKDTWLLWHFGHLADHIGPLRYLKKFNLNGTSAQKTLLSKTRGTMKAIAQVMVDMQLVGCVKDVLTLGEGESSALFDRAVVTWMDELKAGATQGRARWMEMKIPTIYALVLKSRKRRRAEVEVAGEEEKEEEDGSDREEDGRDEGDAHAASLLSQLNGRGRRGGRRRGG
jgi:hypothetical protein